MEFTIELAREMINGISLVLFTTLTFMIAAFMWDTIIAYSARRQDWTDAPGIHTACALWWVFAAESYRSWVIWSMYRSGALIIPMDFVSATGFVLAGFAMVGGLLRSIYIFTPPAWKRRVWVYASLGAVLFVLSPTFLNALKDYINGI